ncbi:Pimeloyl-ACP methyl ester carboxylesterase [Parafrankia irregularis]|uniref:Pimeloyl-ACP methyl ester carboxylesterase n=1 Tax=Parafrankia irregularis TaxID=795642 RepID=A0A0S4QGG3_9ACTN|nr:MULTISPECIES: alpha/beta hydrolase [Parafrankia]MBE3201006.1 alpha/beta hydrolase [Parafrankia sp. CH37]CUU54596.1 Pimeloyl-ACP methyl ester carboxylesterase [Parafrankia irregularis]
MALATVDGLSISYDLIGTAGQPWVITPGGRYSKDDPGIRELAAEIAATGRRVLVWDRPNTGESDVCFDGESESQMQADALAGLIRHLGLGPTVIAGGSGGSRVSLLTAARHRDIAAGLAIWWLSGGVYGLMSIGVHYAAGSFTAAWHHGMEAVADLPEWQEPITRNPANRQRILDQDRREFLATMERWMAVYSPRDGELVPGLPDDDARGLDIPALVFRSGESDLHHRRETSEHIARLLPRAVLAEPPWGDTEWNDRHTPEAREEGLFARWPLLAPPLLAWADKALA